MAVVNGDKYHLRSLHEEIALFDRKLAHLQKYEKFDTDAARDLAARKLTTKRETLVTTARRLAAEGIEFKPSELPRSLRPEGEEEPEPVAVEAVQEKATELPIGLTANRAAYRSGNPYAGTSLDWQASIRQHLAKKNKA